MRAILNRTSALLVVLPAAAALAQSRPQDDDVRRYRKHLEPGSDLERRVETMKNVAFYDSAPMAKLLIDALATTLTTIEELEAERDAIDARIERILKSQIENGAKSGTPNYSGVAELQAAQRAIGAQITTEEHAVRGYVDALASFQDGDPLELLMKLKPKKPARLQLVLIEVLGRIDDGRVAEHLIGLLNDDDLDVRLAAAASLLEHKPEFVPAEAFGPLLRSPEWQERSVAIDALARLGGRDALEMLVHRTVKEEGRLLADLCGRLEQLTGQKLGKTPPAWVAWWQGAKGAWETRGVDLAQPAQVSKKDGKYASFFQVQFDSLRVIYVLDVSGSMRAAVDDYENLEPPPGKSRMELARREVKASLNGLPPEASFNLVAYSDVVLPWNDRNVMATPENKKRAFEWLDGLAAVGQTNIFDALEKAFELSTRSAKDKYYQSAGDTILFMTDGGPTCGRSTDCDEIVRAVADWNRTRRLTLHTVGIGKQTVTLFLKQLAQENGGEFVAIEK